MNRAERRAAARAEVARQQAAAEFCARMQAAKEAKKITKLNTERHVHVTHLPDQRALAMVAKWKKQQEARRAA